jgi:hypothetical protein
MNKDQFLPGRPLFISALALLPPACMPMSMTGGNGGGGTNNGDPIYTHLNEGNVPLADDPEDGMVGFGCSTAITPDGRLRFIAGCGSALLAEYVQVSDGGAFMTLADPAGTDPVGVIGADIQTSNHPAVFRGAFGVGYIVLE